ncbi:MAG: hypothetical protein WA130_10270 [Candidatus Methanoperedens sp.]
MDKKNQENMTICIAAIAKEKDKEYIVFSTDHMVTTALGQFEHSIIKYCQINNDTVAMLAGQALMFGDLIKLNDDCKNYELIKKQIFRILKIKEEKLLKMRYLIHLV